MKFDHYIIMPVETKDAAGILELVATNRERLTDYFPGTTARVQDRASAKSFVADKIAEAEKKDQFTFMIYDTAVKKCAGMMYVKSIDWRIPKAEIAYFIDKAYEGKGIITKAVGCITDYCFSVFGMNKLFLRAAQNNTGSKRVAEKNGFMLEGTLRKDFRTGDGKLIDLYYFGLIKE
jgi:RimJ/RimL family protein N-acetyltransferase